MELFAIFGNPVAHSKSPLMHNRVFTKLNYPACYTRIRLEDGKALKERFLSLSLKGANITVPHKEAAYEACDEVRGFAKKVGVVNTIVEENGKLIGYNTDADGFMYAIREFQNIRTVLVLGAGGTARALVQRFLEENMHITVLNRSKERLKDFASLSSVLCATWEDFQPSHPFDLVVNTTSAGLENDALPAPKNILDTLLDSTRYVADAIYGKQTPFLQEALQRGIPSIDGSAMLLGQGVLANELFTQHTLPKEKIHQVMQEALSL